MTTIIEKINEFSDNGTPMGDVCENCQTEAKPIYYIKNEKFELDIILCPNCVEEFKKEVANINLQE